MLYLMLTILPLIGNVISAAPKMKTPIAIMPNVERMLANIESDDLSLLPDFEGCFCGCPVKKRTRVKRIIGGSMVKGSELFYQVALICEDYNPFGPICGGTIINRKTIVTAAHCCEPMEPMKPKCRIRYNTNKVCLNLAEIYLRLFKKPKLSCKPNLKHLLVLSKLPDSFEEKIKDIIIHPKYNNITVVNDICVVTLKNKLEFYEEPNCPDSIGIADTDPQDNSTLLVSGWGLQNENDTFQPACLKKLNVKVYNREECKAIYGNSKDDINRVDKSTLCAIGANNQDNCSGDSGGPLIYRDPKNIYNIKLVGVVSKGTCGFPGYPAVYASAANLKDFIMKNKA